MQPKFEVVILPEAVEFLGNPEDKAREKIYQYKERSNS